MPINLVIAFSQQKNNKCKMGDTEQDHMHNIARILHNIFAHDKRFNIYIMPKLDVGSDLGNLRESIRLSNAFINANGGKGYHIELHSDAGGYAKGCSALYKSDVGKKLATAIYNELADLTPTTDAGVRLRDNLGALNQTLAISTILEVSFHDEAKQAEWIHKEATQIALSIAKGFYKFLKGELII